MSLWIAAGGYLLFVVYGSLVPLDFHPRPLDAAWREFLRHPLSGARRRIARRLGRQHPALHAARVPAVRGVRWRASRSGIATSHRRSPRCSSFALRCASASSSRSCSFRRARFRSTTSSRSSSAPGSASAYGSSGAARCERLWAEMERGGMPAIRAAVVVYVLAYLAFSLFPYDFLVSAQEFAEKFAEGGYGFLVDVRNLRAAVGLRRQADRRNRRRRSARRAAREWRSAQGRAARLRDRRDRAAWRLVSRSRLAQLFLASGHLGGRIAADARRRLAARCRAAPACAPGQPRRAAAVHRARTCWRRSRSTSLR